jgi:phosphatidylglycerol:prolipoprotein diacylglycerol transferase
MQFPNYVHLFGKTVHPHFLFEALAYAAAAIAFFHLRRRFGDVILTPLRWVVVTAAVAGGAIGSKLLFLFEDPRLTMQNLHNPAYLVGGKTIVGALVFGLISVELMKRYAGVKPPTGDLYAIPLALGIAIGRIGCFLTGLSDNTYGTPTSLPWGVNFGDGVARHPTQIYEMTFLLLLVPVLYSVLKAITRPQTEWGPVFVSGDAFKVFMVAYLSFRLLCDFIKPYSRIFLGLGGIQWACLLTLLYYSSDIARWLRAAGSRYRLRWSQT